MTITSQIRTIKHTDSRVAATGYARRIDGAVESIAIAMLRWSNGREARAAMSNGENLRLRELRDSELEREAATLRLPQRFGL